MKKQAITDELEWLKYQSPFLKISRIERELQMPEGTLHKFVTNKRGLDAQWHSLVVNWIRTFKK